MAPVAADVASQHRAAAHPRDLLARGPRKDHPPGVHQAQRIAALGLLEVGRGPDHRHALGGERLHHPPQLAPRDRIDAHPGFVEQQQFRLPDQRAGKAELLLHAARQLAGQPPGKAVQIGEIEQPAELRLPGRAGDAAQIGIENQVLHHRQILVEAEFLRHVADPQVQLRRGMQRVEPQHLDLARDRLQQPRHQPHQRGLARAIGARKPGDDAARHGQRNVVKRMFPGALPGIAVGQAADRNRQTRRHRAHPASAARRTVTGMPWRSAASPSPTVIRSR
ncbi:hypothetical protein SDC9_46430 [bioreactor metagenome]|uniref:Uncharacterized protein n=1 Tax=bioreactor metagenome TaxID=1076179 RepID=A0A644W9L4_9ZZZZ